MSSSVIPSTAVVSWTKVPDGSAASPAVSFQNSQGTGIYRVSADVLGLSTAGVQRVVIDASGNVGVGTGSPTDSSSFGRIVDLSSGAGLGAAMYIRPQASATNYFAIGQDTAGVTYLLNRANAAMLFYTANAEKVRITTDGRILVNNSLTHNATAGVISATGFGCRAGVGGTSSNAFNINWTGSAQLWIDTTNQGTLTLSSDYRIKKNIETQTLPALERVAKLRPVTYELADYGNLFKADGIVREGFIAHEVQEVIPSGAEGEKDEENRIQNLRVDAILAVAVKAIQELSAKNDALEARLAALEAK